jgi:hypothetical protein
MLIAIPSKARATKQVTLAGLPASIRNQTFIFVEPQDARPYLSSQHRLFVLEKDNQGIGYARQSIVEFARFIGETKLLMMDDDLTFSIRRTDDQTKFRTPTDQQMEMMFHELEVKLDHYAHVGVAPREGANRRIEDWIYNVRAMRMAGVRVDLMGKYGFRYDAPDTDGMEDFTMQLSFLLKGEAHATLNWMVQNQMGSNSSGGMSTYRTLEKHARTAYALKNKFPDYVQVVRKQTKTAWGGQERTDVIVSWKKAYYTGKDNAN